MSSGNSTYTNHSTTINFHSVWFTNPFITRLSVGIVFGEMVSQLILAHMLSEGIPLIPRPLKLLLSVLVYSAVAYFSKQTSWENIIFSESTVLVAYTFAVIISYVIFVNETISGICDYLKISVLTIPYKKTITTVK